MHGAGGHRAAPLPRLVLVGVAFVVGVSAGLSGAARAGSAVSTPDPGEPVTEVPFSCRSDSISIGVAGSARPSPAADGGRVALTIRLRIPRGPMVDEADEVWVTQPLPAEIAEIIDLTFDEIEGATSPAWSAGEGAVTVMVSPDRADPSTDITVSSVATVRLRSGLAPASIVIDTPDELALGPMTEPDSGPPPCTADEPRATLLTFRVVEPPGPVPPSEPPVVPTLPPDAGPDPASGGDAPAPPPLTKDEIPAVPPSLHPGRQSRVLTDGVGGARARLDTTFEELAASTDQVDALHRRSQRLEAAERALEAERDRLAGLIGRARADIGNRSVAAYIATVEGEYVPGGATVEAAMLGLAQEAAELEQARLMTRQGDVLAELSVTAADRARKQASLDRAETDHRALRAKVIDDRYQLNTFRGGGQLAITGFHFPVDGAHDFTDTWLAPRAGGRRHRGTDIFATEGTPLRAVERGALARVGSDRLGGNKLWLVGESGTHYYYAHLSDYAADVADGLVVDAGQVIGYVGHTGDARTTPPHLHFEVHPGGGSAVNGYPMLFAADTSAGVDAVSLPDAAAPPEPEGADSVAAPLDADAHEEAGISSGATVDRDGNVYVAEPGRDRIRRFDADGAVTAEWGSHGSRPGHFDDPTGLAVGPRGDVYVADSHNNRIQVFTADGRFLRAWGATGARAGRFNHPTAVAVSDEGTVFVADTYNNRIQTFDRAGGHLSSWGTLGADDYHFANPFGVAVGIDGDVYVADTFNGRVQHFDAAGRFLAALDAPGDGDPAPLRPGALVVDNSGGVWVTDLSDDRIRQYDRTGGLVRRWKATDLTAATPDQVPTVMTASATGDPDGLRLLQLRSKGTTTGSERR